MMKTVILTSYEYMKDFPSGDHIFFLSQCLNRLREALEAVKHG